MFLSAQRHQPDDNPHAYRSTNRSPSMHSSSQGLLRLRAEPFHEQQAGATMNTQNTPHARQKSACDSTISVAVVRALFNAVERSGVSRAELLQAAQLPPGGLEDADARVPSAKAYELCVLALDLTGDPAFGLHWAEGLSTSSLVPVSHLVAHSSSLRQAFDSLSKYHRLLSDYRHHELLEDDESVTVRCRHLPLPPRMQRFASEMTVSFFFHLIRGFDLHARPHRVSFAYPAPSYRAEYARIFDGTEHFDQPFTGIVFDRALLDRQGPHFDDDVHQALEALAERRLLRITQRTPYSVRIRELLVREGAPQRSDMLTVARALGMSTRSLRRRLASEGKSFNEVQSEALASMAKHLLQARRLTIQETAYEMGFSDARAFHRAFKRWTGMTPNAFREGGPESPGGRPRSLD